jgi:hypothetical protein
MIDLQLELPGKPIRVKARVVWREAPDLVGVEFESISVEGQADLIEFHRGLVAEASEGAVAESHRRWFRRRMAAKDERDASP